ncbi:Membrane protein of ER body 1 [Linum perenne]
MGEVQYQLMTADPPAAMEDYDSEVAPVKLLQQMPTAPAYSQNGSSGTRRIYGGGSVTTTFHGTKVPTPNSDGVVADDALNCGVYFDQRRGKWKCRHCNWTDNSNHGPGKRWKWKCRHCNWGSSKGSHVVNREITGTESADGGKHVRLEAESLTPSNGSLERPKVRWSYRNGGLDSMEQRKDGDTQVGANTVLKKQDTLDLYCPDCSSCITRRVVFNARKQNTPSGQRKLEEEDKPEALYDHPKSDAESSHPSHDQGQYTVGVSPDNSSRPEVTDSSNEREQDSFRCFSCFRFFIPEEQEVDDPAPATSTVPLLEQATDGLVQASTVPLLGNQTYITEHRGGVHGYKWEILKSVVFGGLIESITSLGVVSSAAGANAATLNVLVMGLANLIGGLIIITCNLLDLKHDYSKAAAATDQEQQDRYQRTLGRRENSALHFTAAILSFLLCGLLPTITYGFTFQAQSGDINNKNKEEKLIAAGTVSLACIILLAIGKAQIEKKHQLRTVFYFFTIWIATSGATLE